MFGLLPDSFDRDTFGGYRGGEFGLPALEHVAGFRRIGRRRHGRTGYAANRRDFGTAVRVENNCVFGLLPDCLDRDIFGWHGLGEFGRPVHEHIAVLHRGVRRGNPSAVNVRDGLDGRAAVRVKSNRVTAGCPFSLKRQVLRGHGLRKFRLPAREVVARQGRVRDVDRRAVVQRERLYRRSAPRVESQRVGVDFPPGFERHVGSGHDRRKRFVPPGKRVSEFDGFRRGGNGLARVLRNRCNCRAAVGVEGNHNVFRRDILRRQRDNVSAVFDCAQGLICKRETLAGIVKRSGAVQPSGENLILRRCRRGSADRDKAIKRVRRAIFDIARAAVQVVFHGGAEVKFPFRSQCQCIGMVAVGLIVVCNYIPVGVPVAILLGNGVGGIPTGAVFRIPAVEGVIRARGGIHVAHVD